MKFEKLYDFGLDTDQYGAVVGKFSFVIIRCVEDIGWSASYKDREYEGPQSSHIINNSTEHPFKTRQQAEAACRHKLKELKRS